MESIIGWVTSNIFSYFTTWDQIPQDMAAPLGPQGSKLWHQWDTIANRNMREVWKLCWEREQEESGIGCVSKTAWIYQEKSQFSSFQTDCGLTQILTNKSADINISKTALVE